MEKLVIPKEISWISDKLKKADFEVYLVGGCVRDLLRGVKPKDWDMTTNAKPEKMMELFGEEEAFYENDFGTVTIKNESAEDISYRNVEITPYRKEAKYSNKRHPDSVEFSEQIEDDLMRRDFRFNAIAYDSETHEIIDPYNGQKDIKDKLICAVGDPKERFGEDALRMMRALRLAAELDFDIEDNTKYAIEVSRESLREIAVERVQNELTRIILSQNPKKGFELMRMMGVIDVVIPELKDGIGCEQNGDHIYDVWEHNIRALQHSADRDWPLHVRLAALLHDVGKPATRKWSEEKEDWTFYGHDVIGAKMAKNILIRLKYPREIGQKVTKLVRHHLFFTDIDKITLSAVRRLVANVGPELVWDLMDVRACDRIGMGRPKEKPYRLRKYESMIEEAMRAPVSVAMLKLKGDELMKMIHEKPSPRIGWILHGLLEDVLDDPTLNTEDYLSKKALELSKLTDAELETIGKKAKESKDEAEESELETLRKKYGVK